MNMKRTLRTTHKWVAILAAAPLLFVLVTGIFLQVRKPVDWIQPATERGDSIFDPRVTPQRVLDAVRTVPEMHVDGWRDVLLTDYRPRKGIIKVRNPEHVETQIDAATGEIIKTRQRWNNIVNAMHDGSAFGLRLWLFGPVAMFGMYLVLSGFCLLATITARKFGRLRRRPSLQAPPRRRLGFVGFCVKYHYWAALVVAVPWLVVIASGVVLQLRYEVPGVLPAPEHGVSDAPALTYQQVLDVARTIPALEVSDWSDVWRIYTYPSRGVMEIRTKLGVSGQIDAVTGAVLNVATRSSDFWEDVHQGIFGRHHLRRAGPFGTREVDLSLTVFLPVHLVALLLWLTGVVYFLRRRLLHRRGPQARPVAHAAPVEPGGAPGWKEAGYRIETGE